MKIYEAPVNETSDKAANIPDSKAITDYEHDMNLIGEMLFLPGTPVSDSIKALSGKKMYGREWLTDKINEWLGDDGAEDLLMLYGKPGTGKSMFCAHLYNHDPRAAAYFTCDRHSDRYNYTDSIIRWLAYKLALRLPDYRRLLISLFEDKKRFAAEALKNRFNALIAAPLSKCGCGKKEKMFIIIDDIDENQIDTFAKFVKEYIDALSPWFRIIITSQKVAEITENFKEYPSVDLDSYENETFSDIKKYVDEEVGRLYFHGIFVGEEQYLHKLAKASENIFAYAVLICENAKYELKNGIPDMADLLGYDPVPNGIEGLFKSILDRVTFNGLEYESFRKEPLGMIIAAPAPLPADTLKKLMGWDDAKLNRFMSTLSMLIKEENGCLKVFHSSFAEWLDSTETKYRSGIRNGTENLARRIFKIYSRDASETDEYMRLHMRQLLRQSGMRGIQ